MTPAPAPHIWWQALPNPAFRVMVAETGLAAAELRDPTTHQVRFQLHQLGQGLVGPPIQVPEPWLVTLAAVTPQDLWLHGYADPQLPQPSGLYCLGLEGQLRWHAPQCQLSGLTDTQALVQRRLGEADFRWHLLHRANGFAIRDVSAADAALAAPPLPDLLTAPVTLDPSDPDYPHVAQRLHERAELQVAGPIALLQAQGVTYAQAGHSLLCIARQRLQWRWDSPTPFTWALAPHWLVLVAENGDLGAIAHNPA